MLACRLCGGALRIALDLGAVPPANRYRRQHELLLPEPTYPLRLAECTGCAHVQLADPQPSGLFTSRPYLYQSGVSQTWHRHCKALAQQLPQGRGRLALDLGSNDGTMLGYLAAIGYSPLGIEPSVEQNASHPFKTLAVEWSRDIAGRIVRTQGRAALIVAQNVFAHVEDARGFLAACAIALAPDGLLVIECPDLGAMVQTADFTSIYHEHVHYWHPRDLGITLWDANLVCTEWESLPIHNGSTRYRVVHKNTERASQRLPYPHFDTFPSRANDWRAAWTAELAGYRDAGEVIAGYGASAKAMTLLTTTPVPEAISWIVDDSPSKQGWYTPGEPIPIVPPSQLGHPDRVMILAWNVADEIRHRLQGLGYRGKITVPFAATE